MRSGPATGWRQGRLRLLATLIGTAVFVGPFGLSAVAATVELRGTAAPVNAEKVEFERGGLRITIAGASSTLLAWDQVRDVSGRPLNDAEKAQLVAAEELWRARSRVQRGDIALAAPLLEKHFAEFRGTNSETALVVAEGLLRCQLAREPLRAILPAIEVARLRRAKITTDRYAALAPVLDDATLLCPSIPPTWPKESVAETEVIAREIDAMLATSASFDAETRRVAELYAALLRHQPLPAAKREEGASGLLAAIMELERLGESDAPEAKARVRSAALASAKGLPPWAGGWTRYAVGRSLVGEREQPLREQGVLLLLEIPASRGAALTGDAGGASVPLPLVRAALELAASTLRSLGDAESASIVDRELAATGGVRGQRGGAK